MSQFFHSRNVDNVYHRELLISVLNFLTDKISITNVTDKQVDTIIVPFLYNSSGDERFWQDLFLYNTMNDCIDLKITEGNTDVVPRGHLTLTSFTINVANMVNRHVYGYYTKLENGELLTYAAPIHMLPVSASFSIDILVEGKLNMYKILEKLIQTFYKGHKFSFLHRGMNIEVELGFPDENTGESTYEFSFGDPTTNKISFTLECASHYPIINETEEQRANKRIEQFEATWEVPEATPWLTGVDGYVIPDPEKLSAYTKEPSRKNVIVIEQGKQNYRDGVNNVYEQYGRDEKGGTAETEDINVDNNIHRPDKFGIITKTINDEIEKY